MPLIYTANEHSFTLHVRITKKCNADCSYCSSYESNAKDLMSLECVQKSINFIKNMIIKYSLGGNRNFLTVQYIGGELLTVPIDYLRKFSEIVEKTISPLFKNFKHGCQSNLVGSKKRVSDLIELFDSNIGTSLDTYTSQRTIGKSSKQYQTFFIKNLSYARKITGKNLSSIVVLDKAMEPYIENQIEYAEINKMHITLRPVFLGGKPVEGIDDNSLIKIYEKLFKNWFMLSPIAIEPFFSLLEKRLLHHTNEIKKLSNISGCPFQHNCATSSLNIEPDGTLYVCLDMADGKHYSIGNAIQEIINEENFSLLLSRTEKLNNDCLTCDYFNQCQGGCMNEAIEQQNDVFGKTYYCSIWKKLFYLIDEGIEKYGTEKVDNWIKIIKKTF